MYFLRIDVNKERWEMALFVYSTAKFGGPIEKQRFSFLSICSIQSIRWGRCGSNPPSSSKRNPVTASEYPQKDTIWDGATRYGKTRICERNHEISLADSCFCPENGFPMCWFALSIKMLVQTLEKQVLMQQAIYAKILKKVYSRETHMRNYNLIGKNIASTGFFSEYLPQFLYAYDPGHCPGSR